MEASIVGEFGMEGADEHVGLACSYDAAVDLSEDFDTFAYLLDEGGTDKGHGHRTEATQLADGIEAAQLTAVGIATGMDTHHVEVFVIEHDEAGTGAQDGQSAENSLADRRVELLIAHDTHHGSTLTSGDDETTASGTVRVSLIGLPVGEIADQHGLNTEAGQHLLMLDESPLQGQDSDSHGATVLKITCHARP